MTIELDFDRLPLRARRHHVRDWLGVSEEVFTKMVRAGVLTPHYFLGTGRAIFYREEIRVAVLAGRLTAPVAAVAATAGKTERLKTERLKRKCAA
jgi:hypothetical protein